MTDELKEALAQLEENTATMNMARARIEELEAALKDRDAKIEHLARILARAALSPE